MRNKALLQEVAPWVLALPVALIVSVIADSAAWSDDGGVAVSTSASAASPHSIDGGAPDLAKDAGGTRRPAATVDGSDPESISDADIGMRPKSPVTTALSPTPTGDAGPSVVTRETAARGTAPERTSTGGARKAGQLALLGLNADAGVSGLLPDTGMLLALRPARWAQGQIGIGFNTIAWGIRAGATLINPRVIPLSLTLEGGHYYEGDANRVVHWFDAQARNVSSLRHFSYDYMNLLAGVAFEGTHVSFYIRGGVTWMWTRAKDFAASVNEIAQVDLQADDPKISYRGPAAKLGLIVFP